MKFWTIIDLLALMFWTGSLINHWNPASFLYESICLFFILLSITNLIKRYKLLQTKKSLYLILAGLWMMMVFIWGYFLIQWDGPAVGIVSIFAILASMGGIIETIDLWRAARAKGV